MASPASPAQDVGRRTVRDDTGAAGSGAASAAIGELPAPSGGGDVVLVERLKRGDEEAFLGLVEDHGRSLRRIARMYATDAVAEEVVQETWIAVIRGLDRFEGRASLRTWMVKILINIARNRGEREGRQIPFSAFVDPVASPESAVDPDRFQGPARPFPGRLDLVPPAVGRAARGALPVDRRGRGRPRGDRGAATCPARSRHASGRGRLVVGRRVRGARHHPGQSAGPSAPRTVAGPGCPRGGPGRGGHPRGGALVNGVRDNEMHPNLESYYDSLTDRARVDLHIADCPECQAWLAEIHERIGRFACVEFVELVTDYLEDAVDDAAARADRGSPPPLRGLPELRRRGPGDDRDDRPGRRGRATRAG